MGKKYSFLALGVLALALAWNFTPLTLLIFVGFVPLFHTLLKARKTFASNFMTAYGYILLWQLASTFWLFRTHVGNVLLLNLLNSLLPALIIAIATTIARRRNTRSVGYFIILLSWISLEFAQHRGGFAFPLLALGNVLGDWPLLIQWYEWTGVLGGSIWILAANLMFTETFFVSPKVKQPLAKRLIWNGAILVVPALLSLCILTFSPLAPSRMVQMVSVHPNLDCYTEKYNMTPEEVVQHHLKLSLENITAQTDYLIWPETAIPDGGWTTTVSEDPLWQNLQQALTSYPNLKLITGAIMFHPLGENPTVHDPLVHYQKSTQTYFRTYNAAIQLQTNQAFQMRTKQKLVAFEETLPYAKDLHFLKNIIPSLGNFAFSVAPNNQHLFYTNDHLKVTPLICYETAFGEATSHYVRQGAQILMVILNEGWYQNKFGARQFMRLSQIRAIETRRSVARSSNFGATGFIDPFGRIVNRTSDFKPTVLRAELPIGTEQTVYVKYGDYLGRLFIIMLFGYILFLSLSYALLPVLKR